MKSRSASLILVLALPGLNGCNSCELPPDFPKRVVTMDVGIEIRVNPRKATGEAWDTWGGAPDPQASVNGVLADSYAKDHYQDSWVIKNVRVTDGIVRVNISDLDLDDADEVGNGRASVDGRWHRVGSAQVRLTKAN